MFRFNEIRTTYHFRDKCKVLSVDPNYIINKIRSSEFKWGGIDPDNPYWRRFYKLDVLPRYGITIEDQNNRYFLSVLKDEDAMVLITIMKESYSSSHIHKNKWWMPRRGRRIYLYR